VTSQQLIVAVSSRVAACLGARAADLADARSVDDALSLILNSCALGAISSGYGAVAPLSGASSRGIRTRFAATVAGGGGRKRLEPVTAALGVDRQARERAAVVNRWFRRNWQVDPLDRAVVNVQTEGAQEWAFEWLGNEEPGHPGSCCAVRSDETAELPVLPFQPSRA
jgi:hypothetical protein